MATSASDWLLWQLADSAFPAGAMAHSAGLEAAVQLRLVTDSESLNEFIHTMLRQLHRGVGLFVQRAWKEQCEFPAIEKDCDLFLNSAVANRASRAQGQAFIATAAKTFPQAAMLELAATVRQKQSPGHLAPVFGFVGGTLKIGGDETMRLFSFIAARGCLSSAVRLGVIGPLESQRMLALIDWPTGASVVADEPVQTAPLLDLLQSTQDRLYSRLFQS